MCEVACDRRASVLGPEEANVAVQIVARPVTSLRRPHRVIPLLWGARSTSSMKVDDCGARTVTARRSFVKLLSTICETS